MSLFGVSKSGNSFVEAFDSSSQNDKSAPEFWEEYQKEEDGEIEAYLSSSSFQRISSFILQTIVSFLDECEDFFSLMYSSKIICMKLYSCVASSETTFKGDLIILPSTRVPFVQNLSITNPTGLTEKYLNKFLKLKKLEVLTSEIDTVSNSVWHLGDLEYLSISVIPNIGRLRTETFVRLLNNFRNLHTIKISGVYLFQEKSPSGIIDGNLEVRPNLRTIHLDFEKEVNNNHFLDFHEDFDLEHMKGSQLVSVITKGLKDALFKKTYRCNDVFSSLLTKCKNLESFTLKGQHDYSLYLESVAKAVKRHDLKQLHLRGVTISGLNLILEIFPELKKWKTERCQLKHFRPNEPRFIAHSNLECFHFVHNTVPLRDYVLILSIFPKLNDVVMERCTLTDRDFKDRLPTDFSLEKLDFSNNRIRFKGFKYILKRMRVLKTLKLNNCYVSLESEIVTKRSSVSSRNGYRDITNLELSGCSVGLFGFYEILKSFPNLIQLGVSRGKIVMKEDQVLSEIPGDGKKLKKLDFCGNKITLFGFLVLLKKFVSLEELCVSSCDIKIDEEGFKLLSSDENNQKEEEEGEDNNETPIVKEEEEEEEEEEKQQQQQQKEEEQKKEDINSTIRILKKIPIIVYPNLKKLNLSLNYVKTEGLEDIFSTFPNLVHLDVIGNLLCKENIAFPCYPKLEILQLFMNMKLINEVDILNMFRNNRQLKVISFGDDKTGLKNLYFPIKEMYETKLV